MVECTNKNLTIEEIYKKMEVTDYSKTTCRQSDSIITKKIPQYTLIYVLYNTYRSKCAMFCSM